MIRPCDIILTGCPGVDSPITNLSAEAPDPFLWAGVGYDIYNPYQPPPLGDGLYTATDCYGVAWSATSQAEADFLANQYVILCTQGVAFPPLPPLVLDPGGAGFPTFPGLPPGIAWTPPVFVPPPPPGSQVFANTAQTATASCPNGAVFSYTVAAGLLQSAPINPELGPVMVELLNAEALAYALATVWSLRVCIDLPLLDLRVPPGTPAPADWPPGVDWPVVNPDPNTPPPNWPGGRTWPPPSSRGPAVSANPGWICLGQELDPDLNLYNVTGSGSYTFSIDGDVPPGTDLVTTGNLSAQLEGTPAAPGEYTYTVHAQNNSNPSLAVQVTDTLKVFGMTTTSLPDGTVGTLYGPVQLQTAGGTAPVTFTLVGSLPDGLSLSADGIISGTPTTAGTSTFTVKFTDAENGTCQQDLSLAVTSSGACDALAKLYKITGYGPSVASAIAALFPAAVPSALPEWDGVFRDTGGGNSGVHPECYAIAGMNIDLFLQGLTIGSEIYCGVPGPPAGWQPQGGKIFPNSCILTFPFYNPCATTLVGPPIYILGGFDGTNNVQLGCTSGVTGGYGVVSPPATLASDCSSTVSGLATQPWVIGAAVFTVAVY